ncbi:MAG: hypothetical protein LBG80_00065, partial [Bacteroidales bacterium]|nr:hypothetical protein [Bacteroidales bacterium]
KLASGEVDTIELMSALSVIYPGRYELKVWLESPTDNIIYDNTLVSTYISGKLGLPIDEDFSNDLPMEFITRAVNSPATWTIVPQGTGSDTAVKPAFGSGMLAFTGNKGAMSYLSTRQLELRETVLPTLEFWYFHDTIKSEDYMDVRISTDGGTTYKPLLSVLKQNSVYGWYCHRVDLTPYINGQCIQILFEAMRMSSGIGSQYIDRIVINSQQDLALSKITVPLQSVCDLKTAELEVILSTKTNQTIDLSQSSTSLAVEIPNYPSLAPIPLHKKMEGNSSDSIHIAVPDLPAGNYPIKVYLTSAVDKISGNDTAYYTVDIRPELSITVKSSTGGKNCFKTGVEVQQELILINSGNIDLPNIELLLNIIGDNPQTLKENNTINLSQGDTLDYRFKSVYIVPKEVLYAVKVTAYVDCNGYILIDTSHAASECTDLDNLTITELVNPSANSKDVPNTTEQIIVSVRNESDIKSFSNVTIMALIEDKDGVMLYSRMGTIPRFEADSTYQFTFTEPYNVPDDTVYYIRVYLNNMDIYPEDDTLKRERHTESVGINAVEEINTFTLGQNIPNPATNTTRLDYSIP